MTVTIGIKSNRIVERKTPAEPRIELPGLTRYSLENRPPFGIGPFSDEEIREMEQRVRDAHPTTLTPGVLSSGVKRLAQERSASRAVEEATKELSTRHREAAEARLLADGLELFQLDAGGRLIGELNFQLRRIWAETLEAACDIVALEEQRSADIKELASSPRRRRGVEGLAFLGGAVRGDVRATLDDLEIAGARLEVVVENYRLRWERLNRPETYAQDRRIEEVMRSLDAFEGELAPIRESVQAHTQAINEAVAAAIQLGERYGWEAAEVRARASDFGVENRVLPDHAVRIFLLDSVLGRLAGPARSLSDNALLALAGGMTDRRL